MCHWRARVVSCFGIIGFLVAACGGAPGEKQVFHVAENAQAAVDEYSYPDENSRAPEKNISPEDVELTRQSIVVKESQAVSCDEPKGRIEQTSYPGYLSGDLIPVMLYLPPCYDPYLQVYPVIFLLHGKPQNERHWLLLGVEDVVTQGIDNGNWPPLVLVMPLQPEPLFSDTAGGPGSLEQEILNGLVPFILDRYAITGEAERWAIAGVSRGGVWALELGMSHPFRFQRIGALSPALNVNYTHQPYDPFQMLSHAEEVPERIFLGVGNIDSAKNKTLEFASRVAAKGISNRYLEIEGTHESATWIRLIPEMVGFLTYGW